MKKILLLLTILPCFVLSIKSQSLDFNINNIDPSLLKDANAIVLYDHVSIEYNEFDHYKATYQKVVTVLNKQAKDLINFKSFYTEGSDKINGISIKIINADGEIIKSVKPNELSDQVAWDGFSILTDRRVKSWSYIPNSYPVTIAYQYEKKSKNSMFLSSWYPISQYNVAVLNSKLELKTSQDVRKRQSNFERYPSVTLKGNVYEMNNQPALTKESYAPVIQEIIPSLILVPKKFNYEGFKGSVETWDEFANWMRSNFLDKKETLDANKIKAELKDIVKPSDPPKVIVKKLYNYIQDNTRYISIQLQDGGFNPMPATKVHDVKYGDCKALSFYMKSLLDVYNIPSNYVIISAGKEEQLSMYEDFPCSAPANHAILNVPLGEETIWLDCTTNYPFNFRGSFTDDRTALVINDHGGALVKTPGYSYKENSIEEKIEMKIKEDASLESTIKAEKFGINIENGLYLKDLKGKDLQDYFIDYKFGELSGVKVLSNEFELIKEVPQFNESVSISCENYAEISGDYMFLPMSINFIDIPSIPKNKNRINPIKFNRPYQVNSETTIEVPAGFVLLEPFDEHLTSAYGDYKYTIKELEPGKILVSKYFHLKKGEYEASSYQEVKRFFDQCLKLDLQSIALQNK